MSDSSSILAGLDGLRVWIRVEAKGTFQNSAGLKKFAGEMIQRGQREFVIDLGNCPGMDSTFMGTLAGIALRLRPNGTVRVIHASERNADALRNLGLDSLMEVSTDHGSAPEQPAATVPLKESRESHREKTETMLEAHESLVKASPENLGEFKDVLDYLREDLSKNP